MRCAQLESMTEQEVFNKTFETLRARNWKIAYDKATGMCLYRSPVGPCAAGVHIPDEEYSDYLEQNSWKSLVYKQVVSEAHDDLINAMQMAHDSGDATNPNCDPMTMYFEFRFVANEFNLTIPGEF